MATTRSYLVFLDDGETYSNRQGCTIVGIDADNAPAQAALDEEDSELLFAVADLVVALPKPQPGT